VVWANASGRAGLHFSELSPESLSRLRQWLFTNVMAGVANGEVGGDSSQNSSSLLPRSQQDAPPRPNYSDTLEAVAAVQRQVESLGADLPGALQLIAERAQTLVRASGAAIAMAEEDPNFMVCRASSGPDAPPVGARLQVGSGFSGECVKTATLLRCDDTESDTRVDRESCRALGIRSMVASPMRSGEKSIGLLEVFSGQPNTFSASDGEVLQRLAEAVLAAVNRAARAEDLPELDAATTDARFATPAGSILFASASAPEKQTDSAEEKTSGISLPRSHLLLLICAAAAIAMVLGYNLAPLIQSKLDERGQARIQSVLASSQPPRSDTAVAIESASLEQVRQMAEKGDPEAENALGLRYFLGDEEKGIERDEKQAFLWFNRAAEHGSLFAQAKLGFLYWGGRGVTRDLNQAYFWTVLARARGSLENKDLATVLAAGMTPSQAGAIERQADFWLQEHNPKMPGAGR
jgi:TPR repeat protein